MANKTPPAQINPPERHDPYKMRSLEQILTLFDGGAFLNDLMERHQGLMQELMDHLEEHGPKGCQGSMQITIDYAVGNSGDVGMGAKMEFKAPKQPKSSAAAFINDAGELTLYSPMMARMHQPVRDVSDYDPETGEVRDVD